MPKLKEENVITSNFINSMVGKVSCSEKGLRLEGILARKHIIVLKEMYFICLNLLMFQRKHKNSVSLPLRPQNLEYSFQFKLLYGTSS